MPGTVLSTLQAIIHLILTAATYEVYATTMPSILQLRKPRNREVVTWYIQLVRGEASIEARISGSVVLNHLCYVATENDK